MTEHMKIKKIPDDEVNWRDAYNALFDEHAELKRENEIAKHIGGRIKWFADWHKSKGRSEIKNMPLGMLDEWANTLLTAEESE